MNKGAGSVSVAAADHSGTGGGIANVLWRVNLTEFRAVLRQKAIGDLVNDKIDSAARQLLDAALTLGAESGAPSYADAGEAQALLPCTAAFSVESLSGACPDLLEEATASELHELVRNYLDTMCHDPIVRMASTLNDKYILHLSDIAEAVKQLTLERVILEKFGEECVRLFRLLARKHANGGCSASGQFKFETKQLAAMALLPESRTRPVLMHLFKAGYAQLQEVPRTVDHNPRTTVYLWHVDLPQAYRVLEKEMLSAARKLMVRLEHERSKIDPTVRKAPQSELSEAQQRELRAAQHKEDSLDYMILQILHSVQLMRTLS